MITYLSAIILAIKKHPGNEAKVRIMGKFCLQMAEQFFLRLVNNRLDLPRRHIINFTESLKGQTIDEARLQDLPISVCVLADDPFINRLCQFSP